MIFLWRQVSLWKMVYYDNSEKSLIKLSKSAYDKILINFFLILLVSSFASCVDFIWFYFCYFCFIDRSASMFKIYIKNSLVYHLDFINRIFQARNQDFFRAGEFSRN